MVKRAKAHQQPANVSRYIECAARPASVCIGARSRWKKVVNLNLNGRKSRHRLNRFEKADAERKIKRV